MKSQENQIVVVIKVILCLIIGVLYASWLSDLPDFLFRDRNNYYIYAAYPIERWALITKTWSSIFFKEPLFVLLNLLLQWIFLDPFQTIRYIVFFVAFAVSYFVLYRSKNILFGMIVLIMLFFQSQILALQVVTIRQGVGLAIILWVLPYLKKRTHIVLLFSICGLFHNSFFLLAFFYVIYWVIFFKLKIKIQNVRYFMFIISGIVFFSTFYLITQLVETKQSFEEESLNVGGGAFILWGAVFTYLILFKRHDLRHSEWSGNN